MLGVLTLVAIMRNARSGLNGKLQWLFESTVMWKKRSALSLLLLNLSMKAEARGFAQIHLVN